MPIHFTGKRLPASAYRRLVALCIGLPVTGVALRPLSAQTTSPPSSVSPAAGSPAPRPLRPADLDTMSLVQTGERIPYGSDSLHFGELRLPRPLRAGERVPLAIVIHGGCWISSFATLRNTAAFADALAARGVATWNIEYRRSDHPGGGWPGTFADVARAADHVRTLAQRYPIDTTRVVAVGHSAGGHLALWLGSRRRGDLAATFGAASPMPLVGAVSLGGVTDLEEFAARIPGGCGSGATRLLGGPPATLPDRVALGSPIRRVPLGIPTIHVAGANDNIAPDSVRAAYVARAVAAGDVPPVNVTVPGGHFEVIAPFTAAGATALRQTLTLLGMRPE